MLKHPYSLSTSRSAKRLAKYAKTIIASNLAFAIVALPLNSLPATSINSSGLIIPQNKLDIAFNIEDDSAKTPQIQIPIEFTYMSQGFSSFHPAIDLATKLGTKILPIMPGVVEFAGYSPSGYGNEILIDHGNGLESLYAHLSKIYIKEGAQVDENTVIGLVGVTGHSTGPHLHLEIHQNGKPVNPLKFLPPLTGASKLLTLNQTSLNQQ